MVKIVSGMTDSQIKLWAIVFKLLDRLVLWTFLYLTHSGFSSWTLFCQIWQYCVSLGYKKFYPNGNRTPTPSYHLWFQVQHYPLWTNWTFAYKTEPFGSFYSHALLILAKSSQFLQVQNQVVHEKFKDPLSSTCQISPERILLDLESEDHQGPGFYSHWG